DTLIMTMTATIAGAISMLANFGLFFGHRDRDGGSMLATILAVLVAPFAAMIVQMAISRHREYGADRAGAEISGKPHALASALAKLANGAAHIPNPVVDRNPAAAALYIVPGMHRSGDSLFSTHPDTNNRIALLRDMAQEAGMRINRPRASAPPSVPTTRRRPSALNPTERRR
ncbi:MAG: zinc metalloprotease HtpX, partial [Rhizorhabdus sp.]|nr:zinc metalloprotease HtpX [Rhizorhabdus sp.]